MMKPTIFMALLFSFWTPLAHAQDGAAVKKSSPDYVRLHYTKQDFRIPMRDGVKLFTTVYAPKDNDKPHPILLQRTPYSVGPYGSNYSHHALGPEALERAGFIFVYQ